MILMKKMMPGIRAVCKNPPFVQSELSVPPWQHSTAQLGLQLLGVTHGVPTVLGTQTLTLVGCGSHSALCNAPSALSSALPASLWHSRARTPPAFVPVTLGLGRG